ncbi:MAG: sulfite dehydrogenase [Paracoccaceae bacterium]|nr:sulfite dehydrogenase [Paracoccaceae bacterium]
MSKKFASARRNFVIGSLAAGSTVFAGNATKATAHDDPAITELQPWASELGDGVDASPYGKPSDFEKHVIRRNVSWLTADPTSSVNFTPLHALDGTITPNGLCFERHHGGVAIVNPGKYRLMVNGLINQNTVFDLSDLMRFPRTNRLYFLECAANSGMEWRGAQLNGCQFTHGMIHNVLYTGIKLKDILREVGLKQSAKWILAEGADSSAMTRSIPIEKAMDDCLIAFKMNGESLRPEQGYPVRLVVPGWEGNMWIKWIRRIEVGDKPWHHREETSKYTDLFEDGNARKFTWEMDAKSVITNPSPQAPVLHGRGPMVLTGVAWSGRGKISRVDVSIDGGISWNEARINGPANSKSMHRFYYEFDWNGQQLLLQSRAQDDTGYVQPTKDQLRSIRGENSIYHNNGIQTWAVDRNGITENVEVS